MSRATSSEEQGTEKSPGLEGSEAARMCSQPLADALERARGRDASSPRQSVPSLNYPDCWKDFPNICPRAALNPSLISSCPRLPLLQPQHHALPGPGFVWAWKATPTKDGTVSCHHFRSLSAFHLLSLIFCPQ